MFFKFIKRAPILVLFFFAITSCATHVQVGLNMKLDTTGIKEKNSSDIENNKIFGDFVFLESGSYYLSKVYTKNDFSLIIFTYFFPRGLLFQKDVVADEEFTWSMNGIDDIVKVYVFKNNNKKTILFREPGFQHAVALDVLGEEMDDIKDFLNLNLQSIYKVKKD